MLNDSAVLIKSLSAVNKGENFFKFSTLNYREIISTLLS